MSSNQDESITKALKTNKQKEQGAKLSWKTLKDLQASLTLALIVCSFSIRQTLGKLADLHGRNHSI